ncbi:MAG: shikimate dehydrogenase [Myxococcota bacterium]
MTPGPATRLYAVLGRPVRHSGSPALHNAWFAALGVDAVYLALEVPAGAEDRAVDAVRTLGLAGANLTVPLKERAVAAVDRLDPAAAAVGAVNTLAWADDGALVGHNTDVDGFARSLAAAGVDLAGRDAVVLGAGGAARAVATAIARAGPARLRIAARRADAADALCAALPVRAEPAPIATGAIAGADLVVVATSGRADAVAALDPAVLADGAAWADLNYWDPDPVGLRAAAARGCRTVRGDGMLRWQAALAFERWTGTLPQV